MGEFNLNEGKNRYQGLEIWIQVIQVEDLWQRKQKQEAQISCQYSCR